ncbi:MAG: hypothetical protein ABIG39_04085 [Candidatus Micrarchaeota archaeon]
MRIRKKLDFSELENSIFNIKNEPMPSGAWWWWFWLFFFENPKDPERPRQLMILWSTKNVKEIQCNDLKIDITHPLDRSNLDGAVAAWYFDGEKMRHNFLLEQCKIAVHENGISTDSKTPTSFSINKTTSTVRIGDDIEFIADVEERNEFTLPTYNSNTYLKDIGYIIIRLNKLALRGKVSGEQISGTAYFQRVFVNSPAPSWYWGIFHFEKGAILSYFNPNVFGITVKKDISFFDGEKTHEFFDIYVERSGGEVPTFTISGEDRHKKIRFVVKSYSHSSWTFRKKTLGLIPNKLVYNEYPAVITEFKFTDKQTGKSITRDDIGKAIGNAEHTTGLLL